MKLLPPCAVYFKTYTPACLLSLLALCDSLYKFTSVGFLYRNKTRLQACRGACSSEIRHHSTRLQARTDCTPRVSSLFLPPSFSSGRVFLCWQQPPLEWRPPSVPVWTFENSFLYIFSHDTKAVLSLKTGVDHLLLRKCNNIFTSLLPPLKTYSTYLLIEHKRSDLKLNPTLL